MRLLASPRLGNHAITRPQGFRTHIQGHIPEAAWLAGPGMGHGLGFPSRCDGSVQVLGEGSALSLERPQDPTPQG